LEPAVGLLAQAERGMSFTAGTVVKMQGEEHLRAQIDMQERIDETRLVPIEIKTSSEFVNRDEWGLDGTDAAPTDYCAQLHWQITLTGAPFGRIVALIGADDLRVYTLQADPQISKFLLERARAFWACVKAGVAPDVDFNHPATFEALSRMFSMPKPKSIIKADEQMRKWRDVYAEASKMAKHYQAARDAAAAHFLAHMRDNAILDFGDGLVFERKIVKRKGYTVEPTEYVDAHLKHTPKWMLDGATSTVIEGEAIDVAESLALTAERD
jgi:hypothetical protein